MSVPLKSPNPPRICREKAYADGKFRIASRTLIILFVLIIALFALSGAGAGEIHDGDVAKIGDEGYSTLAGAFTAAQTGATITLLKDAPVTGTIDIGGEGLPTFTLDLAGHNVTGDRSHTIFKVNSKTIFTITDSIGGGAVTGGKGSRGLTGTDGGAVYSEGKFTLDSVTIKDCSATNGGAIYSTGNVWLSGSSVIESCTAKDGGAIYSTGTGTNAYITPKNGCRSIIRNCTAENGGAIYVTNCISNEGNQILSIQNCTAANGGAIYIDANIDTASFSFLGLIMKDCKAANGGALYVNGTTDQTKAYRSLINFNDATIENCSAAQYGGAVYTESNMPVCMKFIDPKKITGCSAANGGGMYIANNGTCEIHAAIAITDCTATGAGGCMYIANGGTCEISDEVNSAKLDITDCSAAQYGGAVYNEGTFSRTSGALTITDCKATDSSGAGGAIYNKGTLGIPGSAISNCTAAKAAQSAAQKPSPQPAPPS